MNGEECNDNKNSARGSKLSFQFLVFLKGNIL